jgi:DNA-directed RNA polymerase specialized sigma24 family protein
MLVNPSGKNISQEPKSLVLFLGGLTVEEAAEVLNISPQTVMRDWNLARAWLTGELAQ